jgi:hypothetical protein
MSVIDNIAKQFKTFAELQQFCEIQFKQLIDLQQKLKDLEDKNKQLQKIIDTGSFIVGSPTDVKKLLSESLDAETICLSQLKILNRISEDRELTLEETKKTEIFYKILTSIQSKGKKKEDPTGELNEEELLTLITTDK